MLQRHLQARSAGSCLFLAEVPRGSVFLPNLIGVSRLPASNKPPLLLQLSLRLLLQPPILPGSLPPLGISRLVVTNNPPDPLQLSWRLLQPPSPLPGVLHPPLNLTLSPLPGPVFAQRQVALPQ